MDKDFELMCDEFMDCLVDDILHDSQKDVLADIYRQYYVTNERDINDDYFKSDINMIKYGLNSDEIQFFLKQDKSRMIISVGDWAQLLVDSGWFNTLLRSNLHQLDVAKDIEVEIEPEYTPPLIEDIDDDDEFDKEERDEIGSYYHVGTFNCR